jgi:hypothetical protein
MSNDGAALQFQVYIDNEIIGQGSVDVEFQLDSVLSWEDLGSQIEALRM